MKKQLRTILAALAISSMMATTAFGAEMVYLNDYEGWERCLSSSLQKTICWYSR